MGGAAWVNSKANKDLMFKGSAGSISKSPCTTTACKQWCAPHAQPWSIKCTWPETCGECSQCSGTVVTTTRMTTTTATTTTVITACESWCAPSSKPWQTKCTWTRCGGCSSCSSTTITTTTAPMCKSWCASNSQTWTSKCTWTGCAGCASCSACKPWCAPHTQPWSIKCTWSDCGGCSDCSAAQLRASQTPRVANESANGESHVTPEKRANSASRFSLVGSCAGTIIS